MDNREKALREQYDRKDPRVQAIERGYDKWLNRESGCTDPECGCVTVLIWDELRPLLGAARAAIEGEPPTCKRCGRKETPTWTCEPCIVEIGREVTREINAERVLEAAPKEKGTV